jgi:mannosyltransferase OCH1-like enzyme
MLQRNTRRQRRSKRKQKKIRRTRKIMRVGGNPSKSNMKLVKVPHFTKRVNKDSPEEINGLPLNIYQTWHDEMVYPKMYECINTLKQNNPEFNHYLYTEEQCHNFIKEHFPQEVAEAYDVLIPYAYKADLWRYCILYKLGGVYIDVKFYTMTSLYNIVAVHPEIFVKYVPKVINLGSAIDKKIQIINGFLVSPPGNEVLKYIIDAVIENTKHRLYKNGQLNISGPMLLADIIGAHRPKNFITDIPFTYDGANVLYQGKEICKQYPEYREECEIAGKNGEQPHYSVLWAQRRIYKL